MQSECFICLENKKMKKFVFCKECCNIFCAKCAIEIEKNNDLCPICRTKLDHRKSNAIRKSFSIIDGEKYKEKKDLIAVAYCHIVGDHDNKLTPTDIIELIKNARKDLGENIPEYMTEILTIMQKRIKIKKSTKNKTQLLERINVLRLNGDYLSALIFLKPCILEKENPAAFEILFKMIQNKEGIYSKGVRPMYYFIFSKLHIIYGRKYDFMFPFLKISYV